MSELEFASDAAVLPEATIAATFVDPGGIHAFWVERYLRGFLPEGGSKVKFLRGAEGAGKTHLLRQLAFTAQEAGYLVVRVDAGVSPLKTILDFYRAVANATPWDRIVERLGERTVALLGYSPGELPPGPLEEHLVVELGRSRETVRREIREAVDRALGDGELDGAFSRALRHLLYSRLLADAGSEIPERTRRWLRGEKDLVRLLPPEIYRWIDRHSARRMLRSLETVLKGVGLAGLLILVDRVEAVLWERREEAPYYTRGGRDEFYETVREFIDDVDRERSLWLLLAGRPELFDDDRRGLRSYPALWLRIQNEVETEQLNRFADTIDLDRAWRSRPETLAELRRVWARELAVEPGEEPPPEAFFGRVSGVRRLIEGLRDGG